MKTMTKLCSRTLHLMLVLMLRLTDVCTLSKHKKELFAIVVDLGSEMLRSLEIHFTILTFIFRLVLMSHSGTGTAA